MRHRTGPAFFNALAIQRRRMQQGFQSHLERGGQEEGGPDRGHGLSEVSELTVLFQGPHGNEPAVE